MPDGQEDAPRPIRVALSNDYEIALLGLAAMLARYPTQIQIVDLTTRPAVQHDPDLILFDTFGRLPENDEKLRQVLQQNAAKVVIYGWEDHYPAEAALRLGAVGFLRKSLGAGELVSALVALHQEGQRQPAGETEEPVLTWPGQVQGLSEREAEILTFIVRGLTNEEIAQRAYLSINTVKTYIRTMYRKIGVASRSQAVAWGFRNGFHSTDDTGV